MVTVTPDQQRCSTQEDRNGKAAYQVLGKQADESQVERTHGGQSGEHEIKVLGGVLAGPDARNETAVFSQVVRGISRIEDTAV